MDIDILVRTALGLLTASGWWFVNRIFNRTDALERKQNAMAKDLMNQHNKMSQDIGDLKLSIVKDYIDKDDFKLFKLEVKEDAKLTLQAIEKLSTKIDERL